MILKERENELAIKLSILSEFAFLKAREPFCCADPKGSIASGEKAIDSAGRKILTRRGLPWNCPDAIEAEQAKVRSQPEIAIWSLGNR